MACIPLNSMPGMRMKAITTANTIFIVFGVPLGKKIGSTMKNVNNLNETKSTAIKYDVFINVLPPIE